MSTRPAIACLGAGRMARGIAVVFAYAGHRVAIVDVKARDAAGYAQTAAAAIAEIRATLATLAEFGLFAAAAVDRIVSLVSVAQAKDAAAALTEAGVIFEAVPEVLDLKRQVLAHACALAPQTIIASTTSTILVDELASAVEASGALSQRALAQSSVSGAASGNLALRAHRSERHTAATGVVGECRQGTGRLCRATGIHCAAHPGPGDE